MIYRVFNGYNASGKSFWKWCCDCEVCLTTVGQCQKVMARNFDEAKEKPQDTALYSMLRR